MGGSGGGWGAGDGGRIAGGREEGRPIADRGRGRAAVARRLRPLRLFLILGAYQLRQEQSLVAGLPADLPLRASEPRRVQPLHHLVEPDPEQGAVVVEQFGIGWKRFSSWTASSGSRQGKVAAASSLASPRVWRTPVPGEATTTRVVRRNSGVMVGSGGWMGRG
jgi:hypothetical protein